MFHIVTNKNIFSKVIVKLNICIEFSIWKKCIRQKLLFLKKIQVPFPDHNKFSAIFINLSLFQTFSVEYSIILSDSHKILTFGHYFSVSSPFVGWSNPGKRTNYVVLGRVEPCDTSLISSGPMWQAIDDESVQIISKHLS